MTEWAQGIDPLGMGAKVEVIRDYLARYRLRTMIETGLYAGRGSGMELGDMLDHYEVVDADPEQVRTAIGRGYRAWCGDSGKIMPVLLERLDRPALFWLDAHAWVGTEFGDDPPPSPLLHELEAILAWPHAAASVVLVDDLRQMAGEPLAQPGWPSAAAIRALVGEVWERVEVDDIMRLTPRQA